MKQQTFKWAGRTAGGLTAVIALVVALRGMGGLGSGQVPQNVELLVLIAVLAGSILGIANPLLGAALLAGGLLVQNAYDLAVTGRISSGIFPLFWIPALLYLFTHTSTAARLTKAA